MLVLALLLCFLSSLSAENLQSRLLEYEKLFTQINKKRIGVSNKKIDEIKNPFITISNSKANIQDSNQSASIKKPTYTLNAILNYKAKINEQWYKLDDKIGDFKLTNIERESVVIENRHSKKKLFMRKSYASKNKFSSK